MREYAYQVGRHKATAFAESMTTGYSLAEAKQNAAHFFLRHRSNVTGNSRARLGFALIGAEIISLGGSLCRNRPAPGGLTICSAFPWAWQIHGCGYRTCATESQNQMMVSLEGQWAPQASTSSGEIVGRLVPSRRLMRFCPLGSTKHWSDPRGGGKSNLWEEPT